MKKIIFILGLLMAASICVKGHNIYNNNVYISIQTFYDELAPYGEWIYTPENGYAWRPYLDYQEDFRPYATRGNWVYTDLGWTWVSEYRWGWATFHYGRWFFDDYLGWMWMPGYEWAPAWVTWGSYNEYWAWAPMGPNMYANLNFNWYAPAFWWTFVPFRNFCANNWYSYTYNQPIQVTNITYITNVYYGSNENHSNWHWYYGPRVAEVERHTQTKVQKRTLVDVDKPVDLAIRDNNVKVYRPGVTQKRENPQPANFRTVDPGKINTKTVEQGRINSRTGDHGKINSRTVENSRTNVRTEPVKQRTTETKSNRYDEPRVQPRPSTQDTKGKNNTGVQNRQVERTTPTRVEPTRKETEQHANSRNTTQHSTITTQNKTTSPSKTNVRPLAKESSTIQTSPPISRSK